MKTIKMAGMVLMLCLGLTAKAAVAASDSGWLSVKQAAEDPRFSISPFASYRVHEFASKNGKLGGGLAAGFAINSHVTLEAEAIAERFDDSHWIESLTEAGANLRLYPFSTKVIKPYGLLGYTRNLDVDQNRMNAGAGLDWILGRNVGVFVDGRWTQDFETVGHALFRLGGRLRF